MVWPSRAAFVLVAASPLGLHAIRTSKPSKHNPHKDAITTLSGDAEGLWSNKAELQKAQAEYCSGIGLTEQSDLDSCMGMAQRARYMCEGIFTKTLEEARRYFHKKGHDAAVKECTIQPDPGQMQADSIHGHPMTDCPFKDMTTGDSHMVKLPKPASCLGPHAPAIQVIPGVTTEGIVIAFEGQGLCTDVASVRAGLCCDRSIPKPQHGIYNHDHPGNPYKDFTMVIMPGCSGDLNVGNVDHQWDIQGYPEGVKQRGAMNIDMSLLWIKKHFGEDVKEIVVLGKGDGATSAVMWAKEIMSVDIFPNHEAGKLILDGFPLYSQGVLSNLLGTWHVTDALLPGELHAKYHDGNLMSEDVLKYTVWSMPKVFTQLITAKADTFAMDLKVVTEQWLQHTVLNHHTWKSFVFDCKPEDYYSTLLDAIYMIESGNMNFVSFLIPGNSANHLFKADLWEASSHGPIGKMVKASTSLLAWLEQGAGLGCLKMKNVCEGPLKYHYDHLANDYDYCDTWLSSFEVAFNCPDEKPDDHVAPAVPEKVKRLASTTQPMEYPRELFASTTPLPANSTEMKEELNVSSPFQNVPA